MKEACVLAFLILSLPAWAKDGNCPSLLVSDRYSNLENRHAKEVRSWVKAKDAETRDWSEAQTGAQLVSSLVDSANAEPYVRQSADLGKLGILELRYLGPEGGSQLVLKTDSGDRPLFDSSRFRFGRLENFVLSPNQRHLVIPVARRGSIDDFELFIIDVPAQRIVASGLKASSPTPVWKGNASILFARGFPDKGIDEFKLSDKSLNRFSSQDEPLSTDGTVSLAIRQVLPVLLDGDKESEISTYKNVSLIGSNESHVFLMSGGAYGNGQVMVIDRANPDAIPRELIPENVIRLTDAYLVGDSLVFRRQSGLQRDIAIYDLGGRLVKVIPIPECCDVAKPVKWTQPGSRITLRLTNEIHRERDFDFDLKTGRFTEDPTVIMLTGKDGSRFATAHIEVTSHDGVKIPVRLVHKAGLLNSGAAGPHPAYVYVYGGFYRGGGFNPQFFPMLENFLERGGIYVAPAVRGGNEFGPAWGNLTGGTRVLRTIEDITSVIESLVATGLATPEKTILSGESNGGTMTALTAMLRPDLIGLAIPINGVLDMMARYRLDARHSGFNSGYGDINESNICEFWKQYSPLELAARTPAPIARNSRTGNFLVVSADRDTRVNPSHSDKFAAILQCPLLSVPDSGHHVSSAEKDGARSIAAQKVIWSAIFTQIGWTK